MHRTMRMAIVTAAVVPALLPTNQVHQRQMVISKPKYKYNRELLVVISVFRSISRVPTTLES